MCQVTMYYLVLALVAVGVALCPCSSLASPSLQELFRLEREDAASRWAPLVWLHPAEDFFPSSVPHFLKHITVSTAADRAAAQRGLGAPDLTLPGGRPSRDFFLTAQHDFDCQDCTLPGFLRGEKPRKKYSPPVYVTVHTCSPEPLGRAARSTKNPLLGDGGGLTSDRVAAEGVIRESSPTSFPFTGSTSASPFTSPSSLPPTLSSFTATQDHALPSTFSLFAYSQTRPTRPLFPSTSEPTDHSSFSEDGNVTSTSPPIGYSEDMAPINNVNSKTDEYEGIFQEDGLGMTETDEGKSTPRKTTVTPGATDESQATGNTTTGFLRSPETTMHPNTAEVNGEDDPTNTTTRGQRHSSTRRHVRLGDQISSYKQVFTLTYWMFYPYNRGKDVCTVNLGLFLGRFFKPRVQGQCHGEDLTMGNHVGDWEHVSINFKGSRPRRMYVSSHTFGAFYTYEPQSHTFVYESQDTREGLAMSPVYPRTIQLTGSHPVLYSARGSHGLWGSEGVHEYNSLPELVDETGSGTPWNTWTNLELVDEKDSASLEPHRNWWRYEGRWGNPSSSCHLLLGGFCENVKGPTGIPRKRINFPCQRL